MNGPKILTLDIETSPHKSWHFDTYNVNISPLQIIEPSRMLCWAAKWEHGNKVLFQGEDRLEHSDVVRRLHPLLDEADVVVTYNGDNFDLPWIEWEFQLEGLPQPSPFVSVDLYKVVKKHFKQGPAKRSLDYITGKLGLTGKLQHEGYFKLWVAMSGDDPVAARRAWNIFRRYNKQDVVTTEELKVALGSKITNIPAIGLWLPEDAETPDRHCPECGSSDYTRQGYRRTKTRRYAQYQCKDCGRWFHDNRSDLGVSAG